MKIKNIKIQGSFLRKDLVQIYLIQYQNITHCQPNIQHSDMDALSLVIILNDIENPISIPTLPWIRVNSGLTTLLR